MRFIILVKASSESEAGQMPTEKDLTEMGQFNEQMVKAGIMLAGEGLHPSSKGSRIRYSGKTKTVIDGPFAETKELVAGFWIIQVKSRDEAIEWMKRAPFDGGEELEIRQVYEEEDFGPELAAQIPEVFEDERKFRDAEEARRQDRQKSTANG